MGARVELDPSATHPLVKHACEQAVRLRQRELEDSPGDDPTRLRARRRSLNELSFAISEGGRVDSVQLRLLLQLLEHYAESVRAERMPEWPGGQYDFLAHQLDEGQAVQLAAEHLTGLLAESSRG
jgi:hypothetical protein